MRTESLRTQRRRVQAEPLTPAALRQLEALRPKRRSECRGGCRPCPWLACRYRLGVEVTKAGSLRLAPDLWTMSETCALDVAERGEELALRGLAPLFAVSHVRVGQYVREAAQRVKALLGEGDE